jgi:prophage DNA circulation protein
MTWRARLLPASFRGAGFHVETNARASGRRIAMHEFPKRDDPYAEDMGRRARRHPVTAYIVQSVLNGFDYVPERDALIDALEAEGPGLLILPTLGEYSVVCAGYNVAERRERGGYCEFEIDFLESGDGVALRFFDDTAGLVEQKADDAGAAAAESLDRTLTSA